MKKIIKYSKSYNNILSIKKSFFEENKKHLKYTLEINKLYKKNPKRKICKNCNHKTLKKFINSFNVDYYICSRCTHLNGIHQDTNKFNYKLYSKNEGKNYSKVYLNDFDTRVKNIYLPKVEFLKSVIKKKINLIEIGSGGGHFLKALEKKNICAIGHEPNKTLCDLGNSKLKKNRLNNIELNEIYEIVLKQTNYNVLALIHVLEHVESPNKLIKNFISSKAKYLYIAVPLHSLSVFLENSFQNVFPRHLGGGHTHLYTENSLRYMAKKFRLNIIGEWWFGADIPDLYDQFGLGKIFR